MASKTVLGANSLWRIGVETAALGLAVIAVFYASSAAGFSLTMIAVSVGIGLLMGVVYAYNSFRSAANDGATVGQLVVTALGLTVPFGLVVYFGIYVYDRIEFIVLTFLIAVVPGIAYDLWTSDFS